MSSAPPADERAPDAGLSVDPAATAARLREAAFVRLVARPDGDAMAATSLLAAGLRAAGTPFQARVRTGAPTNDDPDDAVTVAVGGRPAAGDGADTAGVRLPAGETPASVAAHAVAAELDAAPSPLPALAGAVAAGTTPGTDGTAPLLEAAERTGAVERRPGVAVPVEDLADGLAHATLVRGPFSGDPDRARDRLALDDDATSDDERRQIASLVAVDAATAPDAPPSAADAVERLLRPYATPTAPFATLGGWADILSALANERPGVGVALGLGDDGGYDPRPTALSAWRAHGRAVHDLLDDGTTERYDGLFVVRVDGTSVGRARTAARLVRDFRSPEPAALVVGEAVAAVAAPTDETVAAMADALGAAVAADRTGATRVDDVRETVATVREAAG
jgi:hypothetical protein